MKKRPPLHNSTSPARVREEEPAEPSTLTPKQKIFLAAYGRLVTVKAACAVAGVTRAAHYWWLDSSDEYAQAFHAAKEEAIETLEAEAYRRAVEGVEEPVFQRGEQVGTVRKYSDAMLSLLLKGFAGHRYKERPIDPPQPPGTDETKRPDEELLAFARRIVAAADAAEANKETAGKWPKPN